MYTSKTTKLTDTTILSIVCALITTKMTDTNLPKFESDVSILSIVYALIKKITDNT